MRQTRQEMPRRMAVAEYCARETSWATCSPLTRYSSCSQVLFCFPRKTFRCYTLKTPSESLLHGHPLAAALFLSLSKVQLHILTPEPFGNAIHAPGAILVEKLLLVVAWSRAALFLISARISRYTGSWSHSGQRASTTRCSQLN
jgi:hypothetical protein